MSEVSDPQAVAERLRLLQLQRGLTIQQMAVQSGLPKRSLENYMNLKAPQRPGVDALLKIADGFGVSLDWLVGRNSPQGADTLGREDYALLCQQAVSRLLVLFLDAEMEAPGSVIDTTSGTIMGDSLGNVSSAAMLDFLRMLDAAAAAPTGVIARYRMHYDSLARLASDEIDSVLRADSIPRKS